MHACPIPCSRVDTCVFLSSFVYFDNECSMYEFLQCTIAGQYRAVFTHYRPAKQCTDIEIRPPVDKSTPTLYS